MNKTILILLLGTLIISCGVKKKIRSEANYLSGWYMETEETKDSKIAKDAFLDRAYYIESKPFITISDFKKMEIEKPIWGGEEQVIIGVKLQDDVWGKWADMTERISKTGEKVLFIYEDKVISNLSAHLRIDDGRAMITHERLKEEDLNKIIKSIKREKSE